MPRLETLRQPAAWLLAASGLILYLWAPITVPAGPIGRTGGVAAWLPVVAPVLLYGLLLAGLPGVPIGRRVAGAVVLCLGHVGLGFLTSTVYAVTALVPPARADSDAVWTYPAAAIIQLLAVPLVAFPFRDLLLPADPGPRGRRDAIGLTPTPTPTRGWPVFDDDTPSRVTPNWRRPEGPRPPPTRLASPAEAPRLAAPPSPAVTRTERRGLFEVPPSPSPPAPPGPPAPPVIPAPPAIPAGPAAPAAPAAAAPSAVSVRQPAVILDEAFTELAGRPDAVAEATQLRKSPPPPVPTLEPAAPAPVVARAVPVPARPVAPAPPAPPIPPAPTPLAAPRVVPDTSVPVARVTEPAPPVEPAAAPPLADPVTPAAAEAPAADPIPRTEHVVEAQRIAAILRPVGRLGASVETLMGITLLTACSPRLARDAVVATAFPVLSFLADSPQPVTQATLRGAAGAIVLTPLGPLAGGGPVIVAATPARGSLALLELLARRAAATHPGVRDTAPAAAARTDAASASGNLRDAPVPIRLLQLARSVGAWGSLAPRAFQDRDGELLLYLLLAPGAEAHEVGRFARQLWQVMDVDEANGGIGPVQSLDLRLGDQRVVVRLVAGAPGHSTVLAAAGTGADRPGLAHREVERVAGRLVASS